MFAVGCAAHDQIPSSIPSPRPSHTQTQQPISPSAPISPPATAPLFNRVTAVAIHADNVPPVQDQDRWLRALVEQGVTLLICEVGTGLGSDPKVMDDGHRRAGIYFRSEWAPTVRDVVGELARLAHARGLSVVAALSPRRINWVDPALGWNDRVYDPARAQLRASRYMDLFHPAFQEYLVGLLADLAASGVDGLLFQNDDSLGVFDGFSPFAIQGFERNFHLQVEPGHLLHAVPPPAGQRSTVMDGAMNRYPPEFWRWVGWKARERTKILERLGRAMRLHATNLQLALEVHQEAVTDPRAALVYYGEDLLEAKRRFQYFVLRPSSRSAASVQGEYSTQVIEPMKGLLGGGKRIWVNMPTPFSDEERLGVMSLSDRTEVGEDIGLIYTGN